MKPQVFHPLHWVFSREKGKKELKKGRLWPHMPDLIPAYIWVTKSLILSSILCTRQWYHYLYSTISSMVYSTYTILFTSFARYYAWLWTFQKIAVTCLCQALSTFSYNYLFSILGDPSTFSLPTPQTVCFGSNSNLQTTYHYYTYHLCYCKLAFCATCHHLSFSHVMCPLTQEQSSHQSYNILNCLQKVLLRFWLLIITRPTTYAL